MTVGNPQRNALMDGRSKPRPGVEEQRRILVEAAMRLFAEQPSRSVSVSEICRAADVSRPTFYRCFEDHAALVRWVHDVAVQRYVDAIDLLTPRRDEDLDDWLRTTVDGIVDDVLSTPELARFVFVEYGDPSSPARELVNDAFRATARRLAPVLARRGRRPSERYLMSVFASIQWILFETLRDGVTDDGVAEAKQAVLEAALGMLHGRTT